MDTFYILVTGATRFIGTHVIDNLLHCGLKVCRAMCSLSKGEQMLTAQPQYALQLDFVQIDNFANLDVFDKAVEGVDAVIHVTSPCTYNTTNNKQELIIPAINSVKSILSASSKPESTVKCIMLTSSFTSVIDISKTPAPEFTYTGEHWNPLTYEEAANPDTSAVVAYWGSKKFAELAAWEFIKQHNPGFDLVTLCPPMTFGPVVHPVRSVAELNESNVTLWNIAAGADPLPVSRVSAWIDVRDLAEAHVQALLTPGAGGKRYVPAANEQFSYQLAADIMREEFEWAKKTVSRGDEGAKVEPEYMLDGEALTREMGVTYRPFRDTVVDLVRQVKETLE
ncbi:hypothetical protein AJ80_08328 [Polytolypa hystricis UAMH7299]|uniref:NAD-dependent epimerase/dehydratase domain-containing protein n=1 Tax=Polytolypa hystricis (strain UAMH7299) TaxID=1447883 RepID=A0A2B7X9X9_POLH7|nr:hypothetical protein AJ80_08328 [Polytolypa hystricis UAMH7299]